MTRSGKCGQVGQTALAVAITLGLVATTLASSLASSAARADAASGDPVYIGAGIGYGGTQLFPIWQSGAAEGDPDYFAYCVEHDVTADTDVIGQISELDEYLGENYFQDAEAQGKVLWVIAHSYPAWSLEDFGAAVGVPGISQDDAIEATQYAIWRYTDLNYDATWPFETPDSETAYWWLVNEANAQPGLTPADFEVTASISGPTLAQTAGTLVGPFVVHTNQASASVSSEPSVSFVDASGAPIDPDSVTDGQEIYLDLRGVSDPGNASVTVSVRGSSASGKIVSVPSEPGEPPTEDEHAQTTILIAPHSAITTDTVTVTWAGTGSSDAGPTRPTRVDTAAR